MTPKDSDPEPYSASSFIDGNIVILSQNRFFLVHQSVLSQHSSVLDEALNTLQDSSHVLQGRPVLELQESPEDLYHFLTALCDGVSNLKYTAQSFDIVSALLRLSTKFQVHHLRSKIIHGLSETWPSNLTQWDAREGNATNSLGIYSPRLTIPHPILVINLARSVNAPELLPSAFYDLSRSSPKQIVATYSRPDTSDVHELSQDDFFNLLKGREYASRFLSTFLVNFLEGRLSSQLCIYNCQSDGSLRRTCQAAFEAITFEILRDANGVVCRRNSDPLFAILDTELMQTRGDGRQAINMRPCEYCQTDYSLVVDAAREEFWSLLPEWFGVEVPDWG
ncbi:hypothetical protein K435DRAFT_137658 [Dendrothele bispora CBS 962.96]|uniref:BTB domain-containing protein n=1 Tax=Dendrothele bispora (strain CBS 962.96) TaxID=1314807 RepID=A0A4S8MQ23_DENBC|nr:hypothetical protein K435DRAFT_137658 [Dendrothele bispora CBS 962.96]